MKPHTQYLTENEACEEAVKWADQFDSLQDAWDVCKRGDWMLWLLFLTSGPPDTEYRRQLSLLACQCIKLHTPNGKALKKAERWIKGKTSLKRVRRSASLTYPIADAAATYGIITTVNGNNQQAAKASWSAFSFYRLFYYKLPYSILKTYIQSAEIIRKAYPQIKIQQP